MERITELVEAYRAGDGTAFDELVAAAYPELRRAAHLQLRKLRVGQTLETTALVHETYLKLADAGDAVPVADRDHVLAIAARAMRMILVDHARARSASKRGGEREPITLDVGRIAARDGSCELLDLERAMERLGELDPQLCRVVECRYYAGMTVPETARALELSERTVHRRWKRARAWLRKDLSEAGAAPAD